MTSEAYSSTTQPLLSPDDPPPAVISRGKDQDWLVVSDHASSIFPRSLGNLGLTESQRNSHIGWDIGTPVVARRIAERLRATLIECGYSRLVIDCNRYPQDPASIPTVSGGITIPGNNGLTKHQRSERLQTIFLPYQRAITTELEAIMANGRIPVVLSIHSCSAEWNGQMRPWQIGVSWSHDQRVSQPLLQALQSREDLVVGDNEPYTLDIGIDFTTPEQAIRRGLAHVQVEFRQDLIADEADALHWADIFVDALLECSSGEEWHCADPSFLHLLADASPLLPH